MTPDLTFYLMVGAALFALGLALVLVRRSALMALIGIELMLAAGNLNLLAFWRGGEAPERLEGFLFVLFALAVAAGEAAVGLGLLIAVQRATGTILMDEIRQPGEDAP